MPIAKKEAPNPRKLGPTVRISSSDRDRIKSAAEHMGFSAYTEFMYRASMDAVEAVEAKMKTEKKRRARR